VGARPLSEELRARHRDVEASGTQPAWPDLSQPRRDFNAESSGWRSRRDFGKPGGWHIRQCFGKPGGQNPPARFSSDCEPRGRDPVRTLS